MSAGDSSQSQPVMTGVAPLLYTDQFEEFRAQAKRGSVDSYFIEGLGSQLESQHVPNADCPEASASAPSSRERTPVRLTATKSAGHARSHSFKVKPKRAPQDLLVLENMRPRTASMPNCSCKPEQLEIPDREGSCSSGNGGGGGGLYRVRSFKTSSKGITNKLDFYKSRSSTTVDSTGSNGNPEVADQRRSRSSTPASAASNDSACNNGHHPPPTQLQPPPHPHQHPLKHQHHLQPPPLAHVSQPVGNYQVMMLGSAHVGKTALTKQFMTSEYLGGYARSVSIGK